MFEGKHQFFFFFLPPPPILFSLPEPNTEMKNRNPAWKEGWAGWTIKNV